MEDFAPKKTISFLTKFEFARTIGMILLKEGQHGNTEESINEVKKQILDDKVDVVIRRYLPNESYEDVHIKYLTKKHLF